MWNLGEKWIDCMGGVGGCCIISTEPVYSCSNSKSIAPHLHGSSSHNQLNHTHHSMIVMQCIYEHYKIVIKINEIYLSPWELASLARNFRKIN